ncbi:extracellular solute-binding protein [Salinithrix halophila]|uniref:Extracellular solute-binding protein n=1 Tax=Salinithrix halophila TaxID=1485204 RepID=A0ABV8JBF9_9BACL
MKRVRKVGAWLVIFSLVGGITACSDKEAGQTEDRNKTYSITSLDFLYADFPPKDGEGVKMIEKKFRVNYKRTYGVYTEYPEKVATQVASGDIPDVIGFEMEMDKANFYKWAEQGAFLPLNDYIDDYPTLKKVPKEVWNAFTINGKIVGIPKYYPKNYLLTPIIRKDWLDRLGLEMPTTYEELKKVAIAFTKKDPDGNGKDDTYGMVLGEGLWPNYHFGTYWNPDAWYHKNNKGEFIPGVIAEPRKQWVAFMAKLYKEEALPKDFVLLNPNEANTKEFYAGKAGIMVGGPRGMNETYADALVKIHPKAELAAIPPFKAPDGSRGYTSGAGYYTANALSAKLADDPGKVRRILDIIDFGRRFYPLEQRNARTKDFDWLYGGEGKGYTLVDGHAVPSPVPEGKAPYHYLLDNKMWAPSDEANRYSETYKSPLYKKLAADLEKMHAETDHYANPVNQIYSETLAKKGREITTKLMNEQARMITGDRPLSDWDQIVDAYLEAGGQQMIDEVNKEMRRKKIEPGWK